VVVVPGFTADPAPVEFCAIACVVHASNAALNRTKLRIEPPVPRERAKGLVFTSEEFGQIDSSRKEGSR
jgi:hypothetical protein